MSTPNSSTDLLNMSDEEFAQLSSLPESALETGSDDATQSTEAAKQTEATSLESPASAESPSTDDQEQPANEAVEVSEASGTSGTTEASESTNSVAGETKKADAFKDQGAVNSTSSQDSKAPEAEKSADNADTDAAPYKAFYERVMAPFKANGKLIQLQSADEVVQLMQMGANYTKKMQALQPQKKFLMMLENNNLLDEEKISFLIDLDKKNPEAIKKLLKDANIDPLEVDTSKVNYQRGSHAVSDQEASLTSAIEDLNAQDGGSETLQSIQAWDSASKKALWSNPELLSIFHAQRMNGIYDRITTEMERRKLVGQLSHSTPFLTAYKAIGDELAAQGVFQSTPRPVSPGQPSVAGAPVAVRPAKTPVTKIADNRVKAAATTRTTPNTASASVNYLAMSDEEFLKLANKV